MGGQKIQNVKIISNGVPKDAKWWEDSKSGLKIQIKWYLTPFWPNIWPSFWSNIFFSQKGGQMSFDLNFEARFGILSSFSIF